MATSFSGSVSRCCVTGCPASSCWCSSAVSLTLALMYVSNRSGNDGVPCARTAVPSGLTASTATSPATESRSTCDPTFDRVHGNRIILLLCAGHFWMGLPEAQRLAVHDRLLEELRWQVFGEGCDILCAEK